MRCLPRSSEHLAALPFFAGCTATPTRVIYRFRHHHRAPLKVPSPVQVNQNLYQHRLGSLRRHWPRHTTWRRSLRSQRAMTPPSLCSSTTSSTATAHPHGARSHHCRPRCAHGRQDSHHHVNCYQNPSDRVRFRSVSIDHHSQQKPEIELHRSPHRPLRHPISTSNQVVIVSPAGTSLPRPTAVADSTPSEYRTHQTFKSKLLRVQLHPHLLRRIETSTTLHPFSPSRYHRYRRLPTAGTPPYH